MIVLRSMLLLVATLLLLYAQYSWATACFPWLAARRRWVAAALAPCWLAQILSFWLIGHHRDSTLPRLVAEFGLLPLVLAAFPITAVRLGSWAIGRLGAGPPKQAPATTTPGASMTRRQVAEASAGALVFGATGTMLGWGIVRGRHEFELSEVPVRVAGLPRALDGYVIVQVSDIHTGTHVGEREIDEGLALVRKARPDLVVATGDLVDFDAAHARLLARKLADLSPRDGVAAVLGNHDYYAREDEVLRALRAGGIDALVNEGRRIRPGDGGGFALLGVDDRWSVRYGRAGPRLDRAIGMVPAGLPRILLSHQPPTVDLWAGQVALQLSGHTHGGQINPGFRPASLVLEYLAGLYSVGGTTLYVNRGFGTVGLPARVGAPPEVTRVVLVAA